MKLGTGFFLSIVIHALIVIVLILMPSIDESAITPAKVVVNLNLQPLPALGTEEGKQQTPEKQEEKESKAETQIEKDREKTPSKKTPENKPTETTQKKPTKNIQKQQKEQPKQENKPQKPKESILKKLRKKIESEKKVQKSKPSKKPKGEEKGIKGGGGGYGFENAKWTYSPRRVVKWVEPQIPQSVRKKGRTYRITLRFYIEPDGTVSRVDLIKSSGEPKLDYAFIRAMRKILFDRASYGKTEKAVVTFTVKVK